MAREVGMTFTLNGSLGGGFRSAFRGAKGQIEGISQAIRNMERSPTGKLGASMTQQKAKIKELGESLREAKGRLGELQSRAAAAGGASGMLARQIDLAESHVSRLSGQLQRLSGGYKNTIAEARTAAGYVRSLSREYQALSASMDRANARRAKLLALQQQKGELSSQRSDMHGRLLGAAATAMTMAAPAKISIDFEDAMARVGAVANASEADMAKLTATARQLGKDTVFSASQAAEGMQYLAMAGFDAKETIAAMPGMLDLAAAGNTDLGRTADIASDILSAFKLKASDMGAVSDTLAKTFTTSNTNLEMLGETMKYVGPVAASVGLSLQDTAAATGMLGNVGIKSSQAGTVLRAALLRLAAPPKMAKEALGELAGVAGPELDELYEQIGDTGGAADALKELGMTTKDSAGNLRPLVDILEELNARTAEMGTGQKAEVFKKVFGTEASAGMIALAEQAGTTIDKEGNRIVDSLGRPTNALRAYMEKVNDYQGTSQRIAQQMNATTGGSLRRLKSAWEDVGITVGNFFLPAISGAASALSGFANFISGAAERFPTLSKGVALTIGAFAALSVGSFALRLAILTMRSGLLSTRTAFVWASGAARMLGTGLTTLGAKFGQTAMAARLACLGIKGALISTGIGAIVVALGLAAEYVISHWEEIGPAISAAFEGVRDVFAGVVTFFSTVGPAIMNHLGPYIDSLCDLFSSAASYVTETWNTVTGWFSTAWEAISSSAEAAWEWITSGAEGASSWVQSIWNGVIEFFSGLWNGIANGASAAWNWISESCGPVVEFVSAKWTWVSDVLSTVWNGVVSAAQWAWDGIAAVWAPVAGFFGGVVDGIRSVFTGLFEWLAGKFQWVVDAIGWIKGAVGAIGEGISDAFGAAEKEVKTRSEKREAAGAGAPAPKPSSAPGPALPTKPSSQAGEKPKESPRFTPVKYQSEEKKAGGRGASSSRRSSRRSSAGASGGSGAGISGAASGGSGRRASGGASGASGGSGISGGSTSSGGGTTVVKLAGDNRNFTTQFIPAGAARATAMPSVSGAASSGSSGAGRAPISAAASSGASGASSGISASTGGRGALSGPSGRTGSATLVTAEKPLPVLVQNFPGQKEGSAPAMGGLLEGLRGRMSGMISTAGAALRDLPETATRLVGDLSADVTSVLPGIGRHGPYLPGNLNIPWLQSGEGQSEQPGGDMSGVQVSLHQTFNVGGGNADAIQRRLTAMGPEFESMVRRALSDIAAQDRRVRYAQ